MMTDEMLEMIKEKALNEIATQYIAGLSDEEQRAILVDGLKKTIYDIKLPWKLKDEIDEVIVAKSRLLFNDPEVQEAFDRAAERVLHAYLNTALWGTADRLAAYRFSTDSKRFHEDMENLKEKIAEANKK